MSAIKANQVLNLDGDRIGSVIVDTIANMKNLNTEIEANATVELLGYYSKGDGGGGTFYWDSTSIEDDNGGTIIEATGVVDGRWIRNYSGSVNVKWFGDNNSTTLNIIYGYGFKDIAITGTFIFDVPIQMISDTKLDFAGASCSVSTAIALFFNDSTAGSIVYSMTVDNLTVASSIDTTTLYDIHGMQHCVFNNIKTVNMGGGTIRFAYFNIWNKKQLQNLKSEWLFTGIAQSTDCNFNTINNLTINNPVAQGLHIVNSRGNIIKGIDIEASNNPTQPVISLYNSSYNHISDIWIELPSGMTIHAIAIDGVSASDNKANIIEHVPQILSDNIGILVKNSLNTRIMNTRYNGCSVGIEDTSGNSGLYIEDAQFDNCTVDYTFASSTSIYMDSTRTDITGRQNTRVEIDSLLSGYGGLSLKDAGTTKMGITVKGTDDVDFSSVKGRTMSFVNNAAASRSALRLDDGLNFFRSIAASDANTRTLFVNSADEKLSYKDNIGAIHLAAPTVINYSTGINLASIPAGNTLTIVYSVTGAALGDFTNVALSIDAGLLTITSYVQSTGNVSVSFFNNTVAAVDLGACTLKIKVT